MPATGVLIIGVVILAVTFLAPVRWSFAVMVFSLVVVPTTLVVPNGFSAYITTANLAVLGAGAGLIVRSRRGGLAPGAGAPVAAQAALALFIAVSIIDGVGFAGAGTTVPIALHRVSDLGVQLGVLTITLVVVRTVADRVFVLRVLAVTVAVSAAIAAVEHFTGASWGHFLFVNRHLFTDAAFGLEVRRGHVRVRAGAEFALEYAWTTVMLLPALLVQFSGDLRRRVPRRWRSAAMVGLAAVVVLTLVSVVWSYTRSALATLPVVALLAGLGLRRDRRVQVAIGAAALLAVGAVLVTPSLRKPLSPSYDQASIDARTQRTPRLLEAVSHRPLVGLGLGATGPLVQAPTTDASFLEAYAELGMLGVTALTLEVAVVLFTVVARWRWMWVHRRRGRPYDLLLVGAATTGVAVGVVGAFAFDLFALTGSAAVFWILVGAALGAGVAPAPARRLRLAWPVRALVVPVALVLGLVVYVLAPARSAVTSRILTTPGATEAPARLPGTYPDRVLGRTLCEEVSRLAPAGSSASCREVFPDLGVIEVRVEGYTRASTRAASDTVLSALRPQLPAMQVLTEAETNPHKPSWATTAIGWTALLGIGLVLWLPLGLTDAERSDDGDEVGDGPDRRDRVPVR